MNNDNAERQDAIGFSDGAILSALTGVAYLIVYSYNLGTALSYGIPGRYVSVDTPQVIGTAAILLVFAGLPVAMALHRGGPGLVKLGSFNVRTAFVLLTALVCEICASYIEKLSIWKSILLSVFLVLLGVVISIGILSFIRSRQDPNKVRASRAAFRAQVNAPRSVRSTAVFFGIIAALMSCLLSIAAGYNAGVNQDEFQVIQSGPYKEYAVVWVASTDLLILQRLNRRTHTLTYDVAMIKIEKDQSVNVHVVRTGPVEDVYSNWSYLRAYRTQWIRRLLS